MIKSDGQRVSHVPTREGQPLEEDLPEFLPPVGRSAIDESNGGDISPARVIVEEVAEKVH